MQAGCARSRAALPGRYCPARPTGHCLATSSSQQRRGPSTSRHLKSGPWSITAAADFAGSLGPSVADLGDEQLTLDDGTGPELGADWEEWDDGAVEWSDDWAEGSPAPPVDAGEDWDFAAGNDGGDPYADEYGAAGGSAVAPAPVPVEVVIQNEDEPARRPYHARLTELAAQGDIEGTGAVIEEMRAAGLPPGACAFHSQVYACVRAGDIDQALEAAKGIYQEGIQPLEETYVVLVWGFIEAKDVVRAEAILKSMHTAGKDTQRGWRTLTKGLFRVDLIEEALDHYSKGLSEGWLPDSALYYHTIQAYCDTGNLPEARSTLLLMSTNGCAPETRHGTVLARAYARLEGIPAAVNFIQTSLAGSLTKFKATHETFEAILEGHINLEEWTVRTLAPKAADDDAALLGAGSAIGATPEDEELFDLEAHEDEDEVGGDEDTSGRAGGGLEGSPVVSVFEKLDADAQSGALSKVGVAGLFEGSMAEYGDSDDEDVEPELDGGWEAAEEDGANPESNETPQFEIDGSAGPGTLDSALEHELAVFTDLMDDLGLPLTARMQALLVQVYLSEDQSMVLDAFRELRRMGGTKGGAYTRYIKDREVFRLLSYFALRSQPLQVLLVLQDLVAAGRSLGSEALKPVNEDTKLSVLTCWLAERESELVREGVQGRTNMDGMTQAVTGAHAFDGSIWEIDVQPKAEDGTPLKDKEGKDKPPIYVKIGVGNCVVDDTGAPVLVSKLKVYELRAELMARGESTVGLRQELYDRVKLQRKLLGPGVLNWQDKATGGEDADKVAQVKRLIALGHNAKAIRQIVQGSMHDDETSEEADTREALQEENDQFTINPNAPFILVHGGKQPKGQSEFRERVKFKDFDLRTKRMLQKWENLMGSGNSASSSDGLTFGYEESQRAMLGDGEAADTLEPANIGADGDDSDASGGDLGDGKDDSDTAGARQLTDDSGDADVGISGEDEDGDGVDAVLGAEGAGQMPDLEAAVQEMDTEGERRGGDADDADADSASTSILGATNENAACAIALELFRMARLLGLSVPTEDEQFVSSLQARIDAVVRGEAEEPEGATAE